jgi:hypothetical protein
MDFNAGTRWPWQGAVQSRDRDDPALARTDLPRRGAVAYGHDDPIAAATTPDRMSALRRSE